MIVLDKTNLIPYLQQHYPALDTSGAVVSAIGDDAEDSQGLINYVYRVRTGKGSLIVKQARANMRLDDDVDATDASYCPPQDRNWSEYLSMKLRRAITPDCVPHLLDEKNIALLTSHGVLTRAELESRYEVTLENYCKTILIEANTMVDMARTEIIPAVQAFALDTAKTAAAKRELVPGCPCGCETELVKKLSALTDQIYREAGALEEAVLALASAGDIRAEAEMIRDTVLPQMGRLRLPCDQAETLTPKKYWPFPTYGDLLFGVR